MPSKSCQSQSFLETQQCQLMLHVSPCSYSMPGSCSATPETQLRVTQAASCASCSAWRIKPPCSPMSLMRPAQAEEGSTLRLLCTKTSVLQSAQTGICELWGFESTSRAGMSCPCCLCCIKNINGWDLKHNWVKVMTQPATTTGKYFTGSFDIRFDTTGNGINPWGHTAFRVQHRTAWIPCSSHRAPRSLLYWENPIAIPWTAEVQLDKLDVEYRPSPVRILPCNSQATNNASTTFCNMCHLTCCRQLQ